MPTIYFALAGIFAGVLTYRFKSELSMPSAVIICLGFLVLLQCCKGWRGKLLVWGILLGIGFWDASLTYRRGFQPVEEWSPLEKASLEGIVRDIPSVTVRGKSSRVRFTFDAEKLLYCRAKCVSTELSHPDMLAITSVSGRVQVFLMNPSAIPEPGDRVRIFGGLRRPRNPLNPGEMNYGAYLAAHRVYVSFSGIGPSSLQISASGKRFGWNAKIQALRQMLAGRFDRKFGAGESHSELLKALLLGLRGQFPQELWRVMMRTGTSHILSISGLHMSVLSAFVYLLLLLALRSQKKAAFGAACVLIFYMFLAGGSSPVCRAALMGAAAYAGLLLERDISPMRLLSWVCFLQIAQDPMVIESISFQLSFLSVFVLLGLRYLPPVHWLFEPFRATALVLAGTLPIAAWHFHMVSWIALAANVWAIPFFNFALVTGAGLLVFADVPMLGMLMAKICAVCLDAGFGGLKFLSRFRFGWTVVAHPPLWKIAFYYAWGALWFWSACRRGAQKVRLSLGYLILASWVTAGSFFFISADACEEKITILAGSRLPLVHIQDRQQHWFINTGQASGGYETDRKVIPYLRWRGITRLNGVILTNYPKDLKHCLDSLTDEVMLRKIYGPPPRIDPANARFFNGAGLTWERIDFNPGFSAGAVHIRSMAQHGKTTLLQLTLKSGAGLFLITELNEQTVRTTERFAHRPSVIIFYGAAGSRHPAARYFRSRLRQSVPHALWVFAASNADLFAEASKSEKSSSVVSLKELGALQIRELSRVNSGNNAAASHSPLLQLQFLSGARVTLS